ncbi:S1 family peptidase [Rhizomonospora bruguierae]|uniref:S1 family peptidase n=1 Tax=Rhizomonospora bruguierae TaxID=1581705 RepID=UPI001BCAD25B|nr:S1 family peptidase [Micromonospora sp. NBRC 107566]
MDRRRVIGSVVAVAALGAAAAVTLPALATTQSGPPGAGAGEPPAEVLAAVGRDLKLAPEAARARLNRERWAGQTTAALRGAVGASYAGAWMSADGSQLTVAVTTETAAAKVRAAGAQAKIVTLSGTDLDAVKGDLDAGRRPAARELAGWFVNARENTVTVLAKPGQSAAARRFVAAQGVPAEAVTVVEAAESPRPLFDIRGGDPFIIGGRARCSVGFAVTTGFVTAGHCGRVGDTTTGASNAPQGTFTAATFPGSGDFGIVRTNADWVPLPVVFDFQGGTLPVAGSTEAPVGASICRSGSTTGLHCGVIQAKNATVNYPEGTVTGLTRTNVCAEAGDSGGSWISGDQAQGVTSGGSGDCTVGGTTFFQPVNEILAAGNLTLVTTGGGAEPATPPATAPPATAEPTRPPAGAVDCTTPDVTVRGRLDRAGARETQPNGRFFRAAAGTHTACLDGPAGATFDLGLQRFSHGQWRTVARTAGAAAGETLTFAGPAGFYRYRVHAVTGSGDYTLAFSVS